MFRILLLLSLFFASTSGLAANCDNGRYHDQIFTTFVKTTVTYSTPYNLIMDIYRPPLTDTVTKRPCIFLAHSGSFVGGSRISDRNIDTLCVRMAKRGYVVISIEYRMGNQSVMQTDSIYAEKVFVNAMMDGKAAYRWMVNNAGPYGVDTALMFVGGNSAGGILYANAAWLKDTADCSQSMKDAIALQGGIEGNSGNAGPLFNPKGVIILAGAVHSLQYLHSNSIPCFIAQGDADKDVPYFSGCLLKKPTLIHLYLNGLEKMYARLTELGIVCRNGNPCPTISFHGEEHVPWNTSLPMLNTVDAGALDFIYQEICP